MSNLGNKQTMALNIRNLLTVSGKSQKKRTMSRFRLS